MRLDLRMSEPYEQSLTVEGMGRLIEHLQDFKLAVARTCYRAGHTPSLAFGPFLVRTAIDQALVEMGKETGWTPPDRDWQSLLEATQAFDQATLNAFIEKLISSSYASPVTGAKWNDGIPARAVTRLDQTISGASRRQGAAIVRNRTNCLVRVSFGGAPASRDRLRHQHEPNRGFLCQLVLLNLRVYGGMRR